MSNLNMDIDAIVKKIYSIQHEAQLLPNTEGEEHRKSDYGDASAEVHIPKNVWRPDFNREIPLRKQECAVTIYVDGKATGQEIFLRPVTLEDAVRLVYRTGWKGWFNIKEDVFQENTCPAREPDEEVAFCHYPESGTYAGSMTTAWDRENGMIFSTGFIKRESLKRGPCITRVKEWDEDGVIYTEYTSYPCPLPSTEQEALRFAAEMFGNPMKVVGVGEIKTAWELNAHKE